MRTQLDDLTPHYLQGELQRRFKRSEQWRAFRIRAIVFSGILLALAAIGMVWIRESLLQISGR